MQRRRTRKEDLEIGKTNERIIKDTLESVFGCGLTKDPEETAAIDFYNADRTLWVETKRRLLNHDDHPTAIVSKHKANHCRDPSCEYYFTWVYNDGLWGVKYDAEFWSGYEVKMYKRNDREDHCQELKPHIFVPREHLVLMAAPTNRGGGHPFG